MKAKIKAIQKKVGVDADGIVGPKTVAAIMDALGIKDEKPVVWPTQAMVRSGKSIFGSPGEGELVSIEPPYPLFYEGKQVRTIRVHRLVAEAVLDVLREVLAVYGAERIRELGLDQYGGSYNYRGTTGGSSLSMHAWGVAIDWCPEKNGMKMHAPEASLSREACGPWWEIWEKHGAVSMGRAGGYDWMHVQFARLK